MPLKLVKNRHGGSTFYMRGTVNGIRYDESTGTGHRPTAEAKRVRRETELLNAEIHGPAAVATFASAVEGYLMEGGEGRFMAPLLAHFGNTKLSSIDQAAIDRCARILKPKAARSTVNRQIHTPLSAVLKFAAARKLCQFIPIERPKQPKGKTRWLTVEEASKLVDACSPHLRPLVTFMLYTGARVAEAVYLEWPEVDLDRAHVMFLDTKNGEDRGVPLHPAALAELKAMENREGAVFRKPDGLPYPVHEDGGGQIKTAFNGACRRAGLRKVTPHTLRHTWATWFYMKHRDLKRLMELGGWKSPSMVHRYTHVNSDHNAEAINDLPSLEVGQDWGNDPSRANIIKLKQGVSK